MDNGVGNTTRFDGIAFVHYLMTSKSNKVKKYCTFSFWEFKALAEIVFALSGVFPIEMWIWKDIHLSGTWIHCQLDKSGECTVYC